MNFSFANRRKQIRASININVSYSTSKIRVRNKLDDCWINCELYDISESGLSLRVKQCLVLNEPIKIKIMIEKKRYIYNALIKNVNAQRIGVKYLELGDGQKDSIKTLITNELRNKQKAKGFKNHLPATSFIKQIKRHGTLIAI